MATTDDPYAPYATPVQQGPTLEQQGKKAGIASTQTSTARGQADLPFIAPRAKTELTDAQLKLLRDLQSNARDELKTFEGMEIVKTYDQGMRYFATALTVPVGGEGDQDLVTLAAKVQDPTGAVMQGDIDRYNNVQVALDYVPQWMRNQFLKDGKFTPETRQRIIAFMRNRVDTYRLPYAETRRAFEQRIGGFNEQLAPLGIKPIEVDKILPGDPLSLYAPKIAEYDKRLEADRIRAEREGGPKRADVFQGLPEGTQVAGRDIQGWRFTPESEAEIASYTRSPDATAEGYAQLVADRAVAEGHIPPSQRDDYMQSNLNASRGFFKLPPEQRAGASGVDYSLIDKAATENAGLFKSVAQAVANAPESAAQLAEGLIAIPRDVILSAITGERAGTVKTFTDLAMELGQGNLDGPTTKAFADAMEARYGSLDALKRTAIKDPFGVAGDVSMVLTGGGTAAARAPGAVGRLGEKAATIGRVVDPLSGSIALATEGLPAAYGALRDRAPGAAQGLEDLPAEILAFPSGVGGASLREAAGAGFERGRAGAETPRSEALTRGMREPETTGDDLVASARDAIANLRQQASQQYTAAMQQFGRNPVPLDIDAVRQRMARIKPRSFDTWSTRRGQRPSDHLAWQQMNDFVEEYAQKATKDPTLLEPLAMDQFKQDLYDVGSKIGGAYDRDASRIAGNAYNAVRQELVKHDPLYAETMRDYEKAAREAQQLEASFGLAAARGKQPNVESASRRLQAAIGRNNANVSYGQRAGQVERLNALDPEGTIVPTLAGATLSSWRPRGLNAAVGLGMAAPAALTNPLTLLAAPAFMPRVAGEAAYGAGRVAGTGARALEAIGSAPVVEGVKLTGSRIADLYQKYPEAFLAAAQTGTRLEETEEERRRKLRERYGMPLLSPTMEP